MKTRLLIYSLIVVTIAFGGWSVSTLEFETDISAYNLASSDDIDYYHSFVQDIDAAPNEPTIVILEKESGWTTFDDFKTLKKITSFWEDRPEIEQIYSIVNLKYPKKRLLISANEIFLDTHNKDRFDKRWKDADLYADIFEKFLSTDKKYTLLFLESDSTISQQSALAFERLGYTAQQINIHYLQYDLIEQELQSYLKKDTYMLGILSLVLILVGYYFFTYSLAGIGLIALMVLFNISVTFLAIYLLGMSLTMHMITIPCIITVLSFTDIMHIMYQQKELSSKCNSDISLRQKILSSVKTPLILTSLTNVVGFAVFMILTDNIHLYHYALASIIGVASAYLSSRFLVINLMDRQSHYIQRDHFQKLYAIHNRIIRYFINRKRTVLLIFLVTNIGIISFVVSSFEINGSDQGLTITNASLTKGKDVLQEDFFGNKQIEIFITINEGTIWNKATLDNIQQIESKLIHILDPLYINSPTVIAKRYHRYSSNGRPEGYLIPPRLGRIYTRDLIKNIPHLGGQGIVNSTSDKAQIVIGYKNLDLVDARKQYAEIRQLLSQHNNGTINFELSGLQYLSDEATHSFSYKILIGFGMSILFSSILIFVLLKSIKLGLGIFFVNLFPIFIALSLIITLHIPITPLTLFLLSILLGVCVDDSIYLVLQNRLKVDPRRVLPIFITSIVLSLGFMALLFSSFEWLQPFGWIFPIGIVLAYVLDIFLLPLFFGSRGSESGDE